MILLRLLELNTLLPHYWSELILLTDQLLQTEEEREQLREMIFDVEKMVLETEMVPVEDENGKLVWVEQIRGEMSLYDIEMAIESNADYYAYFEKSDGTVVTKFDIERRLDKIRKWLYTIVRQRAQGRRFQKFR
jgi:hypothetical protein